MTEYEECTNGKTIEELEIELIPVHVNVMRDETHYWNWNKEIGNWIRGKPIPQKLKKAYKSPLIKSNYK